MAGAVADAKSVHHNTPKWVIENFKQLWGGTIDLDPCSNQWSIVGSERSYLLENGDDGLRDRWIGRTYCNPPFGRNPENKTNLGTWVAKAFSEVAQGYASQVGFLLPQLVDRSWWHSHIFPMANAICFVKGRMVFGDMGNWDTDPSPISCGLFYIGPNATEFCRVFGGNGRCLNLSFLREHGF